MGKNSASVEPEVFQIQERVAALALAHSQSEIARRTGTPVSSVNRYLGESRVPADFCAALVRGMGVNPAWLLTGEGSMYLSDVTASTADLGKGMLELVQSLNAVSRMRLGSLTGKHHLRVLRELNEALQTYHGLRDRLNAHSVPMLTQLIKDLIKATERREFDHARDLCAAAKQIGQFCHDTELLRGSLAAESTLEFAMGNAAHALDLSREVFARTLTRTDKPHEAALIQAHNLAASLCQNYMFNEARRVCRLGLALAGDDLTSMNALYELRTLHGIVCVELGDLETGAKEIMTCWPMTASLYRAGAHGIVTRGMLLSGLMSFEEALAFAANDLGRNRQLLRFAIWLEDPHSLARANKHLVGEGQDQLKPRALEATQARLLAQGGKGAAGRREVEREFEGAQDGPIPRAMAEWLKLVFKAQLSASAGNLRAGAEQTLRAEDAVASLGSGMMPDVLAQALHYRNALRSIAKDAKGASGNLRANAQQWLASFQAKGYSFLRGTPDATFKPRE